MRKSSISFLFVLSQVKHTIYLNSLLTDTELLQGCKRSADQRADHSC